jgi:hypothetical protein
MIMYGRLRVITEAEGIRSISSLGAPEIAQIIESHSTGRLEQITSRRNIKRISFNFNTLRPAIRTPTSTISFS